MSNTPQHDGGDSGPNLPGYWKMDAQKLALTIVEPKSGLSIGQKPTVTITIHEFSRMVEGVELSWEESNSAPKKAKDRRRTRRGKNSWPTQFYIDNGQDFNKPLDE